MRTPICTCGSHSITCTSYFCSRANLSFYPQHIRVYTYTCTCICTHIYMYMYLLLHPQLHEHYNIGMQSQHHSVIWLYYNWPWHPSVSPAQFPDHHWAHDNEGWLACGDTKAMHNYDNVTLQHNVKLTYVTSSESFSCSLRRPFNFWVFVLQWKTPIHTLHIHVHVYTQYMYFSMQLRVLRCGLTC